MKPELKQKWIEALRSGEYDQTTGALCEDDAYCCLGVLYDVSGKPWHEDGYRKGIVTTFEHLLYEDLSGDILGEFGLTFSDQSTLIQLNDADRRTFNEIADYIEENL